MGQYNSGRVLAGGAIEIRSAAVDATYNLPVVETGYHAPGPFERMTMGDPVLAQDGQSIGISYTYANMSLADAQDRLNDAMDSYINKHVDARATATALMGAMAQKLNLATMPKCIAVVAWLKAVHDDYYTRLMALSTSYTGVTLDFSNNGTPTVSLQDMYNEILPLMPNN